MRKNRPIKLYQFLKEKDGSVHVNAVISANDLDNFLSQLKFYLFYKEKETPNLKGQDKKE